MRRIVFFFALVAPAVPYSDAQTAPETPRAVPSAPAENQPAQPVLDAEALIVKSDWKGAEARLTPWLADHPTDARALFDAGYAADAQNKLDEAAGLYRRAVQADPKRFEAHLSLGLLLARQGKLDDARPELEAATKLDPGDAGQPPRPAPGVPWPRLTASDNPSVASNDLLEALKLSPERPEDTLLAAELAERSGQADAAEAAYRRLLSADPGNARRQRRPRPPAHRPQTIP